MFTANTTERAGWFVLALSGSLDLASAPAFRSATRSLQLHSDPSRSDPSDSGLSHRSAVAVDLSGVDLIDSVGLGLLVGLRRRHRADPDGRFELRGLSTSMLEVFAAAGLVDLFDLEAGAVGTRGDGARP